MSNVAINIAAEFIGKKAFKQADTATAKLTRSVKTLAGSLGLAFGARGIGRAVQAFAEEDKAARALGRTLDNLGLAFGNSSVTVNAYISRLEQQTGVLDDELRPAMDRFLRATLSVTKSQELLNLALDISAGTGKSVTQVSQSLQKAYLGQTQAIGRLGVGLSKAELATASFEEIQQRLSVLFAGQATTAANTYAGEIAKLQVAVNNAKETIGKGFIDALKTASGSSTIDPVIKAIDKIANAFAYLTRETGEFIAITREAFDFSKGLNFFAPKGGYGKGAPATGFPQGAPAEFQAGIDARAAEKARKLAADQAAKLAAAQKKTLKLQQDALKLAKAKAIFDQEKIQIEAALKSKLSEEDRIRLKLLQAIEEENISNVEKYQKRLEEAQEKTKALQELLDKVKTVQVADPFSTWKVDPVATAINGLTNALTEVRTGMTSTGVAWSDVAAKIAATEVKPNLTQWSSTFKMATDEAESAVETAVTALGSTTAAATAAAIAAAAAATATANAALISTSSASAQAAADAADLLSASNNAALTSTTEAATKAAIDAAAAAVAAANAALTATSSTATEAIGTSTTTATNTTVLAIAESGTATAGTIVETSQAAADALDLLYSNATNALTNATTATTTDFMATSSAALASLKDILAAQANDYAAAAAAAGAQAAADAADLGGAGNAGGGINITVQTGIGDPNAIAEAISEVLREAGTRGTIGVLGID